MLPNVILNRRRAREISVISTLAAALCMGASPSAMAACVANGTGVTCTGPSTGAVNPQPPVADQASTAGQATTTITVEAGSTVNVTGFKVIAGATPNAVDTNTGVVTTGTNSYGGLILPQIYHFDETTAPGGTPAFSPPIEEGEDFHENDVDVVANDGVNVVNNGVITSANVNPVAVGATRNTYGVFLTGSNNTVINNGTISIGNANSTSTMYGVFSSVPTGENYYDNNTVINNGTIEVTRNGAGTARTLYFGEQQLGMNVQNNSGGVLRATRVGAVVGASTNVTAVVDTDDTPGFLNIGNAQGGTMEVTGDRSSVVFGRASGTEIVNSGVIQNNSWTAADTIASAHYAIGSYAGSQYDSDPNSPDPDSPLPNIVNGVTAVDSAAQLSLINTATGVIRGDVLAVDANPFSAYVLGGGFAQSATSGNLSATNVSTRDSQIFNAGQITGNVYLGSGAHEVTNEGTITGNIEVNQEYLCRGTGAQLANCGNQTTAAGTYRIGGDRTFSLVNSGVLGTNASEIRIVDFDNFDVESVNSVELNGAGFSGSVIATNGVGDNTITMNDTMSLATIQGFRTFDLTGSTVEIRGAGGVTVQDDGEIITTITGPGGVSPLAPSGNLGRFAFNGGGTLTLGGEATITPIAAAAIRDGAIYQVASSFAGGDVEATDTALVDWTAYQGPNGDLQVSASVAPASQSIPGLSQPAAAALDSLQTIDGSNAAASALAGAIQSEADPDVVAKAGAQLAPDTSFATQQAALELAFMTTKGIDERLANASTAAPASQPADRTGAVSQASGLWGHFFGAGFDQDRKSGVDGYNADIYGGMVGLDHWLTDEFRVGGAVGYARTRIDHSGAVSQNDTKADSYLGVLYGGYFTPGWYVTGKAGYIYHDYDSTRVLTGPIQDSAKGDHKGHQFTSQIEFGAPMSFSGTVVTPVVGLAYNHLNQTGYRESSANGMALSIRKQTFDSFQSSLGAKIDVPVDTNLMLQARAAWLHEFADRRQSVTASFAGGADFRAQGPKVGRDSASLGAGLTVAVEQNVSVQFDYDALLRSKFQGHAGSGKLRVAF